MWSNGNDTFFKLFSRSQTPNLFPFNRNSQLWERGSLLKLGGNRFLDLCLVFSACSGMMASEVRPVHSGVSTAEGGLWWPWGLPSWRGQHRGALLLTWLHVGILVAMGQEQFPHFRVKPAWWASPARAWPLLSYHGD